MAQLVLLTGSKSLHSSYCRSCKHRWLRRHGHMFLRSIKAEESCYPSTPHPHGVCPNLVGPMRGIHTSPLSRSGNSVSAEVGGRSINFSTGKYAKLASGSVLVESGSASVLVTAVSEHKPEPRVSWLPLQVDYRERGSAANKIPTNFFRRELRATTKELLAGRCIDRSIRPLFPNGYFYDTQVICNMLAVDGNSDHEILSVNGAAAALMLSDIPWNGPIGAVRVGMSNGKLCINPSLRTHSSCDLNLIVACTKDKIVMVEGSAEEVPEEKICEAVKLAFDEAQPLIDSLSQLAENRKKPMRQSTLFLPSEHVLETINSMCKEKVMAILCTTSHTKSSRDEQLFSLLDETKVVIADANPESVDRVGEAFWRTVGQCMQELVLDKGMRCDGRGVTDLRTIDCEVDSFTPLHGSAVFRRGESQVLCSVTFDSPESAAKTDFLQLLLGAQKSKSFMVHYEFPPFATNSTGPFMTHNRREAGHGALAERALAPLVPKDFPFTVRLNSQVLDSNGSTSMAAICGGSLALFDAGVPMPRPAAGVACGLITRADPATGEITKYQILTDLLGIEDANGNMDFKVGGTREGITSLQMDVKHILGIPFHIFEESVMQSKAARHQVLDIMDKCLSAPREELKKNRPAYTILEIPSDKMGRLLGMGGRRLKSIAEDTGTSFTILEDERISVFAPSQEAIDEFQERVDTCLKDRDHEFEIGSVIPAKVVEYRDVGIMMELAPKVYTLLHVSRISSDFVGHPSQLGLEVGDTVNVKYLGRDFLGRHQISRKELFRTESTEEFMEPEFEIGSVIDSTVVDVKDDGVVVELVPRVHTFVSNSKLGHDLAHVSDPSQTGLKVGDKLQVKYTGKNFMGQHQVSRQALLDSVSWYSSNIDTNVSRTFAISDSGSGTESDSGSDSGNDSGSESENGSNNGNDSSDPKFEIGQDIEGTVIAIKEYGVMVELAPGVTSLVHKKNLSNQFVSSPSEFGLEVGDKVKVKYMGINSKGRHEISRKAVLEENTSDSNVKYEIGQVVETTVLEVKDFGLTVELAPGVTTLLHNRDLCYEFICHPSELGISVGDKINVKYVGKDSSGKLHVSRKALLEPTNSRDDLITQASRLDYEIGQVYEGLITNTFDFGVKVRLSPETSILVPNKNLAHEFVRHPSQVGLRSGDKVSVRYMGKDSMGRPEFSRKALIKPDSFIAGQVVEATVKVIRDDGLMVDLAPGVTTLLHKKNLAHKFITHPSQVGLDVGDKLNVKYLGQDTLGRHVVSRKAVIDPLTNGTVPAFDVGQVVEGTVKEVKDFGLVMELAPGVTTLLHNRHLAHESVTHPSQVGLGEGDKVMMKYLGRDSNGRLEFSRKALFDPKLKNGQIKLERGQEFEATVKSFRNYGVMVEVAPGITSLVHKKNLSHEFISHPSEIGLKVGDKIGVKYLGPNISRKALIENNAPHLRLDVGQVTEGTVKEIRVFVEMAPGVVCVMDKSNLAVQDKRGEVDVGDQVKVKYLGRDSEGRRQFSRVGHSAGPAVTEPAHKEESVFETLSKHFSSFLNFKASSPQFEVGQEINATVKEVDGDHVTVELAPGVTSVLSDVHKHIEGLELRPGDSISVEYIGDDYSGGHRVSIKSYP